ncbi:hypothetical protein KZJ38_14215 [Paraburkholderia edwinii]|jgi:hypothetical protein|uniref:Secreted protein n=1 Tax=Paraburkholderia edwinii TaxID=2861782 RepID=A0ABX8UFN8_9BURK|nr:hypothetical protein [Paraburkholderia edwinii]QYD67504.1 hypothetical protein KZJ38_14215 [Paraburkholderia edwinii]
MKKTISMYWPLAIVLPLAAVAFLHLCSTAVKHASSAPLAASEVTAELARTVSYGFVDDDHAATAQSMHTNVTLQSQPL